MPKPEWKAERQWQPVQPVHAELDQDVLQEGSTLMIVSRELQRLSRIVSEVAAIDYRRSLDYCNLHQEASNLAAEIVRLRGAATTLRIPSVGSAKVEDEQSLKSSLAASPPSLTLRHAQRPKRHDSTDVLAAAPEPLKCDAENGLEDRLTELPVRLHSRNSGCSPSLRGSAVSNRYAGRISGLSHHSFASINGPAVGAEGGADSVTLMAMGSMLDMGSILGVSPRGSPPASSRAKADNSGATGEAATPAVSEAEIIGGEKDGPSQSNSGLDYDTPSTRRGGSVEFFGIGKTSTLDGSPAAMENVVEVMEMRETGSNEMVMPEWERAEVCAIWQEPCRSAGKKMMPPRSDSNVSWKFRRKHQEEKQRYQLAMKICMFFMLHPGSRKRLSWDILGFILLCYDLIVIPFQMGFDPEDNDLFRALQWFTILYWTFDVGMSFISGYQAGELIEMRLKKIAIHYLRTWFIFDIVVLSFDWTLTLTQADDSSDTAGLLRLGRRLRFLRILRLLRLVKIQMMMRDFIEHVQSESTLIFSRIGQMIMSIIIANHLIACGWYKLGTMEGQTWVVSNKMEDTEIGYKYTTSLHWSVTQFTPASMEIVPVNTAERIYTVCVVLLAMVAFSSLVSGITNGMTQLRNLNKQRLLEMAVMRRYLAENRISTDLMSNIWGFLDHVRRRRTERTRESDVALLATLPKSLRTELQHEVYWPIVGVHPFFFHFGEVHHWAIRKMYQTALQEISLLVGQEVFTAGEVADRMFFCISGQMTYHGPSWVMWDSVDFNTAVSSFRRNSAAMDTTDQGERVSPNVRPGDWICELALWLESWRHVGKLTGRISSELLAIKSAKFQMLVQKELIDVWQPARYAKDFVDYINKGRIYLHDFWVDFDAVLSLSIEAFATEEDGVVNTLTTHTSVSQRVRKQFSQVSRRLSHDRRTSVVKKASSTTQFRSNPLESVGRLLKRLGTGSLNKNSSSTALSRSSLSLSGRPGGDSQKPGTLYD